MHWRNVNKEQAAWTAATLAICLLFALLNVLISRNEVAEAYEQAAAEQSTLASQAESFESLTDSENLPLVALVSVNLPTPPIHAKMPEAEPLSGLVSPLPNEVTRLNEAKTEDINLKEPAGATHAYIAASVSSNEESPWDAQALMGELSSAQMRISLPSNEREKRQMFDFLYQCVGIGFGAIEPQGGDYNLMPLVNFPGQPSKVLRRISGQMSEQEQTLQQVYARHHALVRVYPAAMDVRLTQYLSKHLQGQKLASFSGEYRLEKNRLLLTNIYINQGFVPQTWLLHDGVEHRCRL
jgi:hypothetical protein